MQQYVPIEPQAQGERGFADRCSGDYSDVPGLFVTQPVEEGQGQKGASKFAPLPKVPGGNSDSDDSTRTKLYVFGGSVLAASALLFLFSRLRK